jgi:hypothetical protein
MSAPDIEIIEAISTLLEHVRHAYDCPEVKGTGECVCRFDTAIEIGHKVLARLERQRPIGARGDELLKAAKKAHVVLGAWTNAQEREAYDALGAAIENIKKAQS